MVGERREVQRGPPRRSSAYDSAAAGGGCWLGDGVGAAALEKKVRWNRAREGSVNGRPVAVLPTVGPHRHPIPLEPAGEYRMRRGSPSPITSFPFSSPSHCSPPSRYHCRRLVIARCWHRVRYELRVDTRSAEIARWPPLRSDRLLEGKERMLAPGRWRLLSWAARHSEAARRSNARPRSPEALPPHPRITRARPGLVSGHRSI